MKHLVNLSFVCESTDLSFAISTCLDLPAAYHCETCSVLDLSVRSVSSCDVFKPSPDGLTLEKVSLVNSANDNLDHNYD